MIFSRSFPRRCWTWVPWWEILARKPLRNLVCPLVFRLLKVGRILWWVQWAWMCWLRARSPSSQALHTLFSACPRRPYTEQGSLAPSPTLWFLVITCRKAVNVPLVLSSNGSGIITAEDSLRRLLGRGSAFMSCSINVLRTYL